VGACVKFFEGRAAYIMITRIGKPSLSGSVILCLPDLANLCQRSLAKGIQDENSYKGVTFFNGR